MAENKRELILLRLVAILGTVQGLLGVHRDRGGVEPTLADGTIQLPAAILLDGSEVIALSTKGKGVGGAQPSTLYTLKPQIFIILMPRTTTDNIDHATGLGAGEELSAFLAKVQKAIREDDTLIALLGSNGEMEYQGSDTDMQAGASIEGQIRVDYAFTYFLNFDQL